MLVKAKWNVKDSAGWHAAGDVWNTTEDIGDAVEVLDVPAQQEEPVEEPEKVPEKLKTSRRKKISG